VVISGGDQDRVFDARDHLLNLEEEYIQDVTENEYMQKYLRKDADQKQSNHKQKQSNGYVVKGAPWEAPPDTQVGLLYNSILILIRQFIINYYLTLFIEHRGLSNFWEWIGSCSRATACSSPRPSPIELRLGSSKTFLKPKKTDMHA
jgi:hypothetical protein